MPHTRVALRANPLLPSRSLFPSRRYYMSSSDSRRRGPHLRPPSARRRAPPTHPCPAPPPPAPALSLVTAAHYRRPCVDGAPRDCGGYKRRFRAPAGSATGCGRAAPSPPQLAPPSPSPSRPPTHPTRTLLPAVVEWVLARRGAVETELEDDPREAALKVIAEMAGV